MPDPFPPPLPFWHRNRLRWVNGLGFAVSLFLTLWLLLATAGSLLPASRPTPMPYPLAYLVAGGGALVATVALFLVVLFRFLWRGADFSEYTPRVYLFFWSLAGLAYFVVQELLALIFGQRPLPNVAGWAQEFVWFLGPFGVLTFAVLAWVNAELPHAGDDEPTLEEDEAWQAHLHDDGFAG